jgi:hypothetical protein
LVGDRGSADCSYHFQLGSSYLVFAYRESNEDLATSICSDTRPAELAAAVLEELRAERNGQPRPTVTGLLRRQQQPYSGTFHEAYDGGLAGFTVRLTGDGRTFTAKSGDQGQFSFPSIPPGKYQFSADLPHDLVLAQTIVSDSLPELTIAPSRQCYEVDLDAMPSGSISGRVLNSDGTPVRQVGVELYLADRYGDGSEPGWWEFQEDNRGFSFHHVAPGEYVLVVNRQNRITGDTPYPRTFYAGSSEFTKSDHIVLADGEQRQNVEIRVGEHKTVIARVVLDYSGGLPADSVFVMATGDGGKVYGTRGEHGDEEISLLTGIPYTLRAHAFCLDEQKDFWSETLTVDPDRLPAPLRLHFTDGCAAQ